MADENITIDELLAGLKNKLCLADEKTSTCQEIVTEVQNQTLKLVVPEVIKERSTTFADESCNRKSYAEPSESIFYE